MYNTHTVIPRLSVLLHSVCLTIRTHFLVSDSIIYCLQWFNNPNVSQSEHIWMGPKLRINKVWLYQSLWSETSVCIALFLSWSALDILPCFHCTLKRVPPIFLYSLLSFDLEKALIIFHGSCWPGWYWTTKRNCLVERLLQPREFKSAFVFDKRFYVCVVCSRCVEHRGFGPILGVYLWEAPYSLRTTQRPLSANYYNNTSGTLGGESDTATLWRADIVNAWMRRHW